MKIRKLFLKKKRKIDNINRRNDLRHHIRKQNSNLELFSILYCYINIILYLNNGHLKYINNILLDNKKKLSNHYYDIYFQSAVHESKLFLTAPLTKYIANSVGILCKNKIKIMSFKNVDLFLNLTYKLNGVILFNFAKKNV